MSNIKHLENLNNIVVKQVKYGHGKITRQSAIYYLLSHPWLSEMFMDMSGDEFSSILEFVGQHEHLNNEGFKLKLIDQFLDNVDRPDNWQAIHKILTIANETKWLALNIKDE